MRASVMRATSVTSKGQVTIPREVRQSLGIRQGSRIEFLLRGSRVELRVEKPPAPVTGSGFGLLKSRRKAVAADLDPATLVKTKNQE